MCVEELDAKYKGCLVKEYRINYINLRYKPDYVSYK